VGSLLVLWDVDFTLVNSHGLGEHLYRLVFRDLFGRELPTMAPMAGRTDRAIILDTLARAGVGDPAAHLEEFLAKMSARAPALAGLARERVRALPGASAALAAVAAHPAGAVQSVLTGNMPALAQIKLAAPGLTRHLDLSVGAFGDHHEVRAELVHAARRKAAAAYGNGFPGRSTVLVGDTALDVAAALAAGARGVAVATGYTPAPALAAFGAHAVLPDLTSTPAVVAAIVSGSPAPVPPQP
jgi:phosphoglycolate phosphatase-like HAD superfamily hydrolase